MATKLSRKMLKGIVKECLVEILQEGIMTPELATESRRTVSYDEPEPRNNRRLSSVTDNPEEVQLERRRRRLEEMTVSPRRQQPPSKKKEIRRAITENVTSDPMMASIFEDTAARMTNGNAQSNPTDIPLDVFEDAAKWEKLAFASTGGPLRK